MTQERISRIAAAVLTFCALLVLAPSKLLPIWEHAAPVVRAVLSLPVLIVALQVLAFATHRRWLLVLGTVVAAIAGLGSLVVGVLAFVIAVSGNLDVITSFFVVGVYGAVVACHLGFVLLRRQAPEVAAPAPPA